MARAEPLQGWNMWGAQRALNTKIDHPIPKMACLHAECLKSAADRIPRPIPSLYPDPSVQPSYTERTPEA